MFVFCCKNIIFYPQMMVLLKRIIALNLYIGIDVWQMVESESLLHNKVYVWKTIFLQQLLYFVHKCFNQKFIFWLTQAPNTSMHIPWNKGATM